MPNVTLSAGLTAILAAPGITNRLQACAAFKNALGDTRRVLIIHNGVTVRDCALSGSMQSSSGSITGFGITSDDTASLAADLSTGSAIMRVTGGGHTVEGSLGLLGSGAIFIAKASLTPTNGLALFNIDIPLRQDLAMGGPGAGIPYRIELESRIGMADSDPTPGPKTSIYFDENAGDIVPDHPLKVAEVGSFGYWRSTETFKHGTGGNAMEIGFHRATIPPQCNDEANVPVYEVFAFMKPYNRWAQYPAMATYSAATDSTFLAPCKFRVFDSFDSEVPMSVKIAMHDDIAINSPQMAQTRNATTRWRPFVHCGQMLYGSTHRLKLSVNARKLANGMVPGTSNRPGQARTPSSANRAYPALPTAYSQINGFGLWWGAPPYSMTTLEDYPQTDPYLIYGGANNPTYSDTDGARNGSRAVGFMCEPGAPACHDWNGPPGGQAMDRFFMSTPRAAYLTEPNGVRPQGSVPYKLLNYEYNKGYFNHGHHHMTNVRTAATLPHDQVAYGQWAYCNGWYTTQGPIFVAGGTSRHIDIFGKGDGSGIYPLRPYKDKDGLLPYQGWENDIQHSYHHPAWFAWDFNSVAAIFSAMMRYNSNLMSFGPSGSPFYNYAPFLMQRIHAWRWHSQNLMWAVGCTHPALLSQAQIETRAVQEFDAADTEIRIPATTPAHAQYNSVYNTVLRNFGIPGVDYVQGDQHIPSQVDDGKLLYLGGVLSTMETSGFTARMTSLSAKSGSMIEFIKNCVHTYAVKNFSATRGRELIWMNRQSGPAVPVGQPLTFYSGYTEYASIHAPVNGQKDLVRNPDGTPYYVERQQYQHIWIQTIFQFRDYLGGEAKWPGINAVCAIAQEQEDFKANLIATNYYNGIYGDYEYRWPAAGIQAPPQA